MDFNLHAGNQSSFLSTPPDGCFASQDPRDVLLGKSAMHNLPPSLPDHKAIGRSIMKARIREEILLREMAERRILEAEVRREIQIERVMEMRRIQMEKLSLLSGTNYMANQGNQLTQPFFPSWSQATGQWASRNFAQDAAEVTFRERSQSPVIKKNPMAAVEEPSLHHKSEKSLPSEERKTPEKFLVQTEKEWGCALCKVYAPSESGLKTHLQGKKHRAKQALLGSKNTITDHKEAAFLSSKKNSLRKEPLQTSQKTIHSQEKFLVQIEKEWGCALCKVYAPCESGLKAHLRGKKHKANQALLGSKNTITDHKEAAFPSSENSLRKEPLQTSQKTIHSQPKKNETLKMKGALASGPGNEKQPLANGASASGPAQKLWCPHCKVMCNSETMLENHKAGKKHQASMKLKQAVNNFATNTGK